MFSDMGFLFYRVSNSYQLPGASLGCGNKNVPAVSIAVSFCLTQPEVFRSQGTQGSIEGVSGFQEPSVDAHIFKECPALQSFALRRGNIGAQHGACDGMRKCLKTDSSTEVALFCQKRVRDS